jgi:hypothetical protein
MRGKPLRGRLMSSASRASGAWLGLLTGIWLGCASAPPASASTCPNAQFRSGPSEFLPDCRVYEQVSPIDKDGQDALTLQPMFPAQASPCEGSESCAIAYMSVSAAFAGALANEYPNAYLTARSPTGWQTTPLSPPTPQAPVSSNSTLTYDFSEDLSQVVIRVPPQQLTDDAPAGVYNLYLRGPSGAYSLLTSAAPPELPEVGCGRCFEHIDLPAFAGASSDFGQVLFEADDSLVAGAPGGGVQNLYEAVAGQVRLVGILPDGAIPAGGATGGAGIKASGVDAGELRNAISQDGSHVLFEAAADGGAPDDQQLGDTELYDRIDGSSTVEVSAPAPGAQPSKCETKAGVCSARPAQFWAASANGSVVYFTSKAALTKTSHTGPEPEDAGNDLYRYDVDSGTLSDLTPDAYNDENKEEPNGASVLGVVGASEDGSYVYFVATGRLAEGAASGKPNLYVWHETGLGAGSAQFIATLAAPSEEELEDLELMFQGPAFSYASDAEDWTRWPSESQAYVTPDGRHLAFMSSEPLTGYENKDQAGEAVHEVFEYNAESGQLACASCDPSGARPLGSAFIGATLGERASTPFHQPRSLSDDGSRLFFSSPDPLAGVAGGSIKVFEYEDGAIKLISGAEAGGEAVFLDADASGSDVFFATRERLAPTDTDELLDVYDARVGGGLPAPSQLSSCASTTCQEPLTPPPSLAAPLSASFTDSGNLLVPTSKPPVKLTRKQLLLRALGKCRKLTSRTRRSACVARARRRYGPKPKAKHRIVATRRRRP